MPSSNSPKIKPTALRSGDTVGIIAPASNIRRADLEAGCEAMQQAGYRPFYFDSILEKDLYFAGSVDRRVRELEEMLLREDVRAIVSARGGYGANYVLNRIDLDKVKAQQKIFVGYSDVTCLLTHFSDSAGLVVFHGPMAAKDWAHDDGVDISSWKSALSGTEPWEVTSTDAKGLVEGEAEASLYGGCLSILVASLGTPYEIKTAGKILFLEDIAAKPYQVDRMLMQLKLGGFLKDVRGIIFGEMLDCTQTTAQGYTLEEIIMRIVGDLGVPVAFGLRSGHVTSRNITLPFGVRARLSVQRSDVSLKILEAAIRP